MAVLGAPVQCCGLQQALQREGLSADKTILVALAVVINADASILDSEADLAALASFN